MKEFLKVKDQPDLVRHSNSKAILNTNTLELNKYKQIRDEKLKLKQLAEEQEQIKRDLSDIKSLLLQLIGQQK
jgi:hypothetical protein